MRDHDTIILGGLIETDKNKNNSGVPFLMDIPLLGYLFRSSHSDETRNELIVLIRPTVLPTPEIAALTATAEKNKMPGVRATEKEIQAEEVLRQKAADKEGRARLFPTTTESVRAAWSPARPSGHQSSYIRYINQMSSRRY